LCFELFPKTKPPNIDPIELLTPRSSPLPLHPNLLIPRPTGDGTLNSRQSYILGTPSNGAPFLVMELWATLRENSTTFHLKLGLIRSWPSARARGERKKLEEDPLRVYYLFGEARLSNISIKTSLRSGNPEGLLRSFHK